MRSGSVSTGKLLEDCWVFVPLEGVMIPLSELPHMPPRFGPKQFAQCMGNGGEYMLVLKN